MKTARTRTVGAVGLDCPARRTAVALSPRAAVAAAATLLLVAATACEKDPGPVQPVGTPSSQAAVPPEGTAAVEETGGLRVTATFDGENPGSWVQCAPLKLELWEPDVPPTMSEEGAAPIAVLEVPCPGETAIPELPGRSGTVYDGIVEGGYDVWLRFEGWSGWPAPWLGSRGTDGLVLVQEDFVVRWERLEAYPLLILDLDLLLAGVRVVLDPEASGSGPEVCAWPTERGEISPPLPEGGLACTTEVAPLDPTDPSLPPAAHLLLPWEPGFPDGTAEVEAADGSVVAISDPALFDLDAGAWREVGTAAAPDPGETIELLVNTTDDRADGACDAAHCSLRDAIVAANESTGLTIGFLLAGEGPHVIRPTSPLPPITRPLWIDGFTQPGASPASETVPADIRIVLNGSAIGAVVGLDVRAPDVLLRGLEVRRFEQGVGLHGDRGRLEGSHLLRNVGDGVFITGSDNVVGGSRPGEGNVLSGNDVGLAIFPGADRNAVLGNVVGLDPSTTELRPNARDGIAVSGSENRIGGTAPGEGNRIAPHGSNAVLVARWTEGSPAPDGNVLQGNEIGTVEPIALDGPGGAGVSLDGATNTLVGGESAAGNVIRGHRTHGVLVDGAGAVGNRIEGNRISGNAGLGLDLRGPTAGGVPFVTPNDRGDGDAGPNGLQNFPEVTTSSLDFESLQGRIESAVGTEYRVELFTTSVCDERGYGEGEQPVGAVRMTTGARGVATFSATLAGAADPTAYFTATATGPEGTSEFARCFPVGLTLPPDDDLVTTEPLAEGPTGGPGFVLQADPAGGAATTEATVCGMTPLRLTAGDRTDVGCGSTALSVQSGPIEVALGGSLSASLGTGVDATVREAADGSLTAFNEGGGDIALFSGDTELGPLVPGETLVQGDLSVDAGRIVVTPPPGRDHLTLEGTFRSGATSDGFDPSTEATWLAFGPFQERLPAGSFRPTEGRGRGDAPTLRYNGRSGPIATMTIEPDGRFRIVARRLDLDGVSAGDPVPFALRVGDDVGAAAVRFGAQGGLAGGGR